MKFSDFIKGIFPKHAPKNWPLKLSELGFDKILFPILIIDGNNLEFVNTLKDFATDPDIYFWEYDSHIELLDSNGNVWSWKYDQVNETNLPGDFKRTTSLDEVKILVNNYFRNTKVKDKVKSLTEEAASISEMMEGVGDMF